MSEKTQNGDKTNLEDELRTMLLSNVRIPAGGASSTSHVQRDHDASRHGQYTQRYEQQQPFSPGVPRNMQIPYEGHSQPSMQYHVNQLQSPRDGIHTRQRGGSGRGFPRHSHFAQANYQQQQYNQSVWQDPSAPVGQLAVPPIPTNVPYGFARPPPKSTRLYQPNQNHQASPDAFIAQCEYLDSVAATVIGQVEVSEEERSEKHAFRQKLEMGFRHAATTLGYTGSHPDFLMLKPFGSLESGFAIRFSDVDLALKIDPPLRGQLTYEQIREMEQLLPRYLEGNLLDFGIGARLLTRTRVPILKVCERPTPELLAALRKEREKWDSLSKDEKLAMDAGLYLTNEEDAVTSPEEAEFQWKNIDGQNPDDGYAHENAVQPDKQKGSNPTNNSTKTKSNSVKTTPKDGETQAQGPRQIQKYTTPTKSKPWSREKARGPLDFPKEGVGIQADININFSSDLAIYNTQLLAAYAACDPRVKPMVLFVKAWAKCRKINSSYSGTLSSYGYVIMVLHFLMNIARPPVIPNLQTMTPLKFSEPSELGLERNPWRDGYFNGFESGGYEFVFWGDQKAIKEMADQRRLTQNTDSLGVLLRNFFEYYSYPSHGFQWTQEVISIRLPGGLQTKEAKGWVGAKTTKTENREIRNRYLFAIEDPLEIYHNVARTVTHPGIVAIRNEFRRAWRILRSVGNNTAAEGGLFDAVIEQTEEQAQGPQEQQARNGGSYSQVDGRDSRAAQMTAEQHPVATSDDTHPHK